MTDAADELAPVAATASARGGFLAVAAGLGVFGLATYGFLGLAGQSLGPAVFAPLSVLWTLLNAVGIGLFLPVEQELGRTTAAGRARGTGNRPTSLRVAQLCTVALVASALVVILGYRVITDRLFPGYGVMVVLLVPALAGMAVAYYVRGLLSGNGRFGHYGAQLAVDGVLRVGAAGVLGAVGVGDVRWYGVVLVVAPLLAVLVTTPRPRTLLVAGPPVPARVVAASMGVLVVASLASQVLANAGPLIVQLLADATEQVQTSYFLAALVIARVPVFAFAAVQAVLLPGLAALAAREDVAGFRRRVGLVTALTAGVAAVGVLAVWVWGDVLVPLLFGDTFSIGRTVITLIAVSGGLFMLAQLAAQALLALGGDRWVVVGWVVGLVALVLASLRPGPVTDVAAVALVVGSGVSMVLLAAALVVATKRMAGRVAAGGVVDG